VIFALAFSDCASLDACDATAHQTVLVEFPIPSWIGTYTQCRPVSGLLPPARLLPVKSIRQSAGLKANASRDAGEGSLKQVAARTGGARGFLGEGQLCRHHWSQWGATRSAARELTSAGCTSQVEGPVLRNREVDCGRRTPDPLNFIDHTITNAVGQDLRPKKVIISDVLAGKIRALAGRAEAG
jgi:hypothetical protein